MSRVVTMWGAVARKKASPRGIPQPSYVLLRKGERTPGDVLYLNSHKSLHLNNRMRELLRVICRVD